MPIALVKSLAEEKGIALSEAEKRWDKAKEIAANQTGMTEKDGDAFWAYVTGVFKKSMGVSEDSVHESSIVGGIVDHSFIEPYLGKPHEQDAELSDIDTKQLFKYILSLSGYFESMGMTVKPYPKVKLKEDKENAANFFGRTAEYHPTENTIVLYCEGRHMKDILRSFAHEMVHHVQNIEGRLGQINTSNVNDDVHLLNLEKEAYLQGNIVFRKWEDSLKVVAQNSVPAMEAELDEPVMESGEDSLELKPGVIGTISKKTSDEINLMGFDTKPSTVTVNASTIKHIMDRHGKQLEKGDEKYLREAIENPSEILPNIGTSGKEYRGKSVLLIHRADKDHVVIVEIMTSETANILWTYWKKDTAKSRAYLEKFRKEKARILQSGGAAFPHIPHNTPEGEVGKPESLSGSQIEKSSFDIQNIAKNDENVKPIMEAAIAEEIHAAAHEAATSHLNDLPQPTDAQKSAGNFKHGHFRLHGLGVTVEIPKGGTRSGTAPDGTKWAVVMGAHYGFLKRTEGADGENFDVFVGDNPESEKVFIVDQLNAGTGKFDESKGILAVDSAEEARKLYLGAFSDGRGEARIGALTELSVDAFKKWLREGDTKKPVSNPMHLVMESSVEDLQASLRSSKSFDDIFAVFKQAFPLVVRDISPFEDWRIQGEWIRHSQPKGKLTKENADSIIALFEKNKIGATFVQQRGIIQINSGLLSNVQALWEEYGSKGKKVRAAEAAKKEREDKRKAQEQAVTDELAKNPATAWISETFGADSMNIYNKLALAKFLTGESKTFVGALDHKWKDGLDALGALNEDGKIDFPKIKEKYESSERKIPPIFLDLIGGIPADTSDKAAFEMLAIDYHNYGAEWDEMPSRQDADELLGRRTSEEEWTALQQAYVNGREIAEHLDDDDAGDENVNPQWTNNQLYHATPSNPFTHFDKDKMGANTDEGQLGRGVYLSTDVNIGKNGENVLKAAVILRKPLLVKVTKAMNKDKQAIVSEALGLQDVKTGQALTDELIKHGYDGVVLDYSPFGYHHQEVMVIDPEKVKVNGWNPKAIMESASIESVEMGLRSAQSFSDIMNAFKQAFSSALNEQRFNSLEQTTEKMKKALAFLRNSDNDPEARFNTLSELVFPNSDALKVLGESSAGIAKEFGDYINNRTEMLFASYKEQGNKIIETLGLADAVSRHTEISESIRSVEAESKRAYDMTAEPFLESETAAAREYVTPILDEMIKLKEEWNAVLASRPDFGSGSIQDDDMDAYIRESDRIETEYSEKYSELARKSREAHKQYVQPILDEKWNTLGEINKPYAEQLNNLTDAKRIIAKEMHEQVIGHLLTQSSVSGEQATSWIEQNAIMDKNAMAKARKAGYDAKEVKKDLAAFYRMTGGRLPRLEYITTRNQRSMAGHWSGKLYVGSNFGKRTFFHELAHLLEEDTKLLYTAQAFIAKRRESKDTFTLRTLTKNNGYKSDEYAYKDTWFDPYVGKVYSNATEVLSMGMQMLASPELMMSLHEQDPEHLALMLGICATKPAVDVQKVQALQGQVQEKKQAIKKTEDVFKELDKKIAAAGEFWIQHGVDIEPYKKYGATAPSKWYVYWQGEHAGYRSTAAFRSEKSMKRALYLWIANGKQKAGNFNLWTLQHDITRKELPKEMLSGDPVPDIESIMESAAKNVAFIKAPNGALDFGYVTPEIARAIGRESAPIRLRVGNSAEGLTHIEKHRQDYEALGYKNAIDFVYDITQHFDAIYSPAKVGRGIVIVVTKGKVRFASIQLEPVNGGAFYDVKNATPGRGDQFKNKSPLWSNAGPSVPIG